MSRDRERIGFLDEATEKKKENEKKRKEKAPIYV